MDELNKLFSSKRFGDNESRSSDPRSEFQRDFDRIIFSSAFRRLQNKTQVFPLPGSVFVHNRLTHSLEVSSVARSLGTLVGKKIFQEYENILTPESKSFYKNNLKNVLAAACLCHDIGNPAFGHSGEDAIASFFVKNQSLIEKYFKPEEYNDFLNFEGNANAIRILTNHQNGKLNGGLRLTYTTLAAIAKYPCESSGKNSDYIHRKKFGFFQSEKDLFEIIADETSMKRDIQNEFIGYYRHPYVWLVEVADDICYHIIDLEDAQRLKIIEYKNCKKMLIDLISCIGIDDIHHVQEIIKQIKDRNEVIGYLRAKSINSLIMRAQELYFENLEGIIEGVFKKPIFDIIIDDCTPLKKIIDFSVKYIYNNRSVVEIENAGYNVMYELLNHFIFPVLKKKGDRTKSDNKALLLIPKQFRYFTGSKYQKVMGILDYISGMTDIYATELYRKIKGIDIGMR